jgi:hypothetical protein
VLAQDWPHEPKNVLKMKSTISILGIVGALCLFPGCKKDDVQPIAAVSKTTAPDTASLYVLLDSKACATVQSQYSSATIDIRGIQVFSTEHGWQDLTTVPGAWDVVSLQTAPVPVADLTETTKVKAGAITKIKLTIGDNNQLVVDDKQASCYKIAKKEIILDVQADVKANALNEIVISIDICGNFTVEQRYQEDPCYTLNPVFAFQNILQR